MLCFVDLILNSVLICIFFWGWIVSIFYWNIDDGDNVYSIIYGDNVNFWEKCGSFYMCGFNCIKCMYLIICVFYLVYFLM